MWFTAVASVMIVAAASGIMVEPPMGVETADARARVVATFSGLVALLLGMTAVGLMRHQSWAPLPIMCIWPLILIVVIGSGAVGVIPVAVAGGLVAGAIALGVGTGWLLFRYKPSVDYFAALYRH